MSNKYCNLDGSKKISEDYVNISLGFDKVQEDINTPTYSAENTTTAVVTSIPATAVKAPFSKFVLKGNTVVNLLGVDGDCEDTSKWLQDGCTNALESTFKVFGSNSIKVTMSAANGGMYKTINTLLNASKYYCISAYINSGNIPGGVRIFINGAGISTSYITTGGFTRIKVVLTPAQVSNVTNIQFGVSGAIAGQYYYIDGVMVNEITATDYALSDGEIMSKYPYVSGMQGTVGQKVTVTGKNLIRNGNGEDGINSWEYDYATGTTLISNNGLLLTAIEANGAYKQNFVLNTNTNYYLNYISSNVVNGVCIIFATNDNVSFTPIITGKGTFNSGNYKSWRIIIRMLIPGICIFNNIQIEQGSTSIPYEPYTKTSVVTTDIGYSLPNGVCDEIDILTGIETQRVGKVVLNGSENWSDANYDLSNTKCFVVGTSNSKIDSILISDKFKYYGNLWSNREIVDKDEEGIAGHNANNSLYVRILKSKLTSQDAAGFKAWLAANPTTVIYQLAQPIITHNPSKQLVAEPSGQIVVEFGWKEKVLQASDVIIGDITSYSKISYFAIPKPTDYKEYDKPTSLINLGTFFLETYNEVIASDFDNTAYIGKVCATAIRTTFWVGFPKGTTLSQAQAALTGKVLTYKLANSGILPTLKESHAISVKAQIDCNTDAIVEIDETVENIGEQVSVKANRSQESWINATLINGWVNYGGDFAPASYYKDNFGIVHLRGLIKSGITAISTPILTLPNGYKPSKNEQFAVYSNEGSIIGAAQVVIGLGHVQFISGGNGTFALSGISFRAE